MNVCWETMFLTKNGSGMTKCFKIENVCMRQNGKGRNIQDVSYLVTCKFCFLYHQSFSSWDLTIRRSLMYISFIIAGFWTERLVTSIFKPAVRTKSLQHTWPILATWSILFRSEIQLPSLWWIPVEHPRVCRKLLFQSYPPWTAMLTRHSIDTSHTTTTSSL